LQAREEYDESIDHIRSILKGNIAEVIAYLKQLMKGYANNFQFEDAQLIKEKIYILSKYQSKSTVVNPSINNVDVFSFVERGKNAFVNYLKLMNGAIVQSRTVEMTKKLDESPEELLAMAIVDIRDKVNSQAKDIYLPFPLHHELEGTRAHVPQRGDKKKLMDLSRRNAQYYMMEKEKRLAQASKKTKGDKILQMVKEDLRMKELPRHIECFDNSNIQGTHPVASCVVFRDGAPSKKEYRKFHIKTVEGPNDFASMEEVVYRRYHRLLDEKLELPQLVIVDGGKGQLSAAVTSLEKLGIARKITIIGIAKKLEEIYFPGDPVPLYIDKNSPALKLIQKARDEAHRFGLAFHRNNREKSMISSELTTINGIGNKTAEQLVSHFKSVKKMRQASMEELVKLVGAKKAKILFCHLHPDQNAM
jgi:excinuclease ABC subunit C